MQNQSLSEDSSASPRTRSPPVGGGGCGSGLKGLWWGDYGVKPDHHWSSALALDRRRRAFGKAGVAGCGAEDAAGEGGGTGSIPSCWPSHLIAVSNFAPFLCV